LGQVLSNLLNNAVQHGKSGMPITLLARGEADSVTIKVTNLGPPIPAEALQVIFNPLVQVQSEDPKAGPLSTSLGLGLFVAREIVVGHGGTLRAESEVQGTVFTMVLPRTFKGRGRLGP
jgi:signal transduction histidine kinase